MRSRAASTVIALNRKASELSKDRPLLFNEGFRNMKDIESQYLNLNWREMMRAPRMWQAGTWQTWALLARAQVCQSCGPGYWPEELAGSATRLQVSPRLSRAALGECLSVQSSACASALVSCSVERLRRSSSISLCEGPVKTGHGLRCAS